MKTTALLIVNPMAGAGRAAKAWARLQQRFPVVSTMDMCWTRWPGEAIELARAAAGVYAMVVAVGGDGTVNEVATGLLEAGDRRTELGLWPLGTGNDAARAVGIVDAESAWKAFTGGRTQSIDVIEVTCQVSSGAAKRYALVYAAAGFVAEILERTTPRVKRWMGRRGCYTVGFLRALAGWHCPRMRWRADGWAGEGRLLLASAGNAEWVGGGMMRLSPGALLEDGRMNINLIPALGLWRGIRHFPRLYCGTHLAVSGVQYLLATELHLESDPLAKVQVDGEVCGKTPARFRLCPRALRLRVGGG